MSIKVILADDHAIVRESLACALKQEEGIEVVAQADNGIKTIKLVSELAPDVVIMDITMPEMNGIDATAYITKNHPNVKVIALSMHSSRTYIAAMLKAGAKSYLLKDCPLEELVAAIHAVVNGESYISSAISEKVVDCISNGVASNSVFSSLSQREKEVLQLIAEGKSTKEIGVCLNISPKTVEAHRLRLMDKLKIDSVAILTKYAIHEGLAHTEI
jgi:two-component system, NarL family, response regulator NreC